VTFLPHEQHLQNKPNVATEIAYAETLMKREGDATC